jgi:hypothetical protein
MADFIISPKMPTDELNTDAANTNQLILRMGPNHQCKILGMKETYNIIQKGEDFIVSIGYVSSIDGSSTQETLSKSFLSFQESQIGELKKTLIGEYILLLKKGPKLFIFSDFMGIRNVFYSQDICVASSSFSRIEEMAKTESADFDSYKFVEFIAMRYVLYPTWLGSSTYHKRINWLLPYEYLIIDVEKSDFKIGSISFTINNKKQTDVSLLSAELLSILRKIVARKEFKYSNVAATLTGGHDSRLIAALALEEFPNIRFRTAASLKNPRSLMDKKVAVKLARTQKIPHDIFWFEPERDEAKYQDMTEGLSPAYNDIMGPLIEKAGNYSLGFGGAFGTELFMPIPWESIAAYVQERINTVKIHLHMEDSFWISFRESLYDQFRSLKERFHLSENDDRDYIRLFCLLVTARYGSFILSAFNRFGFQLDSYGNYAVLDLALRVAPTQWGDHKKFVGKNLVQKDAMRKLNARMGSVMAYQHFRPMLPLTLRTCPRYFWGTTIQVAQAFQGRLKNRITRPAFRILPGGQYRTDGWDAIYISRTEKKYGVSLKN